jgi:hypothetical protein
LQADGLLIGEEDLDAESGSDELDGVVQPGSEQRVRIRTGVVDEKAAALCAVGLYAQHVPGHFAPYLEQALNVCKEMAGAYKKPTSSLRI